MWTVSNFLFWPPPFWDCSWPSYNRQSLLRLLLWMDRLTPTKSIISSPVHTALFYLMVKSKLYSDLLYPSWYGRWGSVSWYQSTFNASHLLKGRNDPLHGSLYAECSLLRHSTSTSHRIWWSETSACQRGEFAKEMGLRFFVVLPCSIHYTKQSNWRASVDEQQCLLPAQMSKRCSKLR